MGSREKVEEFLSKSGVTFELREFGESTKNSALAAQALGCTVAEIAKSVVFVGKAPCVVIISGDKKVDPQRLAVAAGEPVRIANPQEVREKTGFPIGGVPPFPHEKGVLVFADSSLARFDSIWAAAGTPNTVFRMRVVDLLRLLGSEARDISM